MEKFDTGTLHEKRQVKTDANIEKNRKKTRKYKCGYLNFGFTVIEKQGIEHPQCVICCKILAAECMLLNKLKRHLTTNHNYLSGKPREFFTRKLSKMKKHLVIFLNFLSIPAKTQLSSFKISHTIAKCKKTAYHRGGAHTTCCHRFSLDKDWGSSCTRT